MMQFYSYNKFCLSQIDAFRKYSIFKYKKKFMNNPHLQSKNASLTVRPSSTGPPPTSLNTKDQTVYQKRWKHSQFTQSRPVPISNTLNQYPFAPIQINNQNPNSELRQQRLRAINGNMPPNPRSGEDQKQITYRREPSVSNITPLNNFNSPSDAQQVYVNQTNNFNVFYKSQNQQKNLSPTVRQREVTGNRGQEIFNYFNSVKDEFRDGRLSDYIRIDEVKELREQKKNASLCSYGKIRENSSQIQKIEKQNSQQSSKIKILQKQLNELKKNLQSWWVTKQKFTKQLVNKNNTIEQLEKQQEKYKIEIQDLKKRGIIQQGMNENAYFQKEIQSLKGKLSQQQEKFKIIQNELKNKKATLAITVSEKIKLKEKIVGLEEKYNDLSNQNTCLHQKIKHLNFDNKQFQDEIRKYQFFKFQQQKTMRRKRSQESIRMKGEMEKNMIDLEKMKKQIVKELNQSYQIRRKQLEENMGKELEKLMEKTEELSIREEKFKFEERSLREEKLRLRQEAEKGELQLIQKQAKYNASMAELAEKKKSYEAQLFHRIKEYSDKQKLLQKQYDEKMRQCKEEVKTIERNILQKNKSQQSKLQALQISLMDQESELRSRQFGSRKKLQEQTEKMKNQMERWKKTERQNLERQFEIVKAEIRVQESKCYQTRKELQIKQERLAREQLYLEQRRKQIISRQNADIQQLEAKKIKLFTQLSQLEQSIHQKNEQICQLSIRKGLLENEQSGQGNTKVLQQLEDSANMSLENTSIIKKTEYASNISQIATTEGTKTKKEIIKGNFQSTQVQTQFNLENCCVLEVGFEKQMENMRKTIQEFEGQLNEDARFIQQMRQILSEKEMENKNLKQSVCLITNTQEEEEIIDLKRQIEEKQAQLVEVVKQKQTTEIQKQKNNEKMRQLSEQNSLISLQLKKQQQKIAIMQKQLEGKDNVIRKMKVSFEQVSQKQKRLKQNLYQVEKQMRKVGKKYQQLMEKSYSEQYKYDAYLDLLNNQSQMFMNTFEELNRQNQTLYANRYGGSKQQNKNNQFIPNHSALIIQYLTDSLFLSISHKNPQSQIIQKLDILHQRLCEIAGTKNAQIPAYQIGEQKEEQKKIKMSINIPQGQDFQTLIPKSPSSTNLYKNMLTKIRLMEDQYQEVLQIFSVNADTLSAAGSDIQSQREQLSSRSFINEMVDDEGQKEKNERKNSMKSSTSSHQFNLEFNSFLKENSSSSGLKKSERIHQELLKMINGLIGEFKNLMSKVEFYENKIESLDKQNEELLNQNVGYKESIESLMEQIKRIKNLTEKFQEKLQKRDRRVEEYQQKINSYKKYMLKTDKMLSEANCQLMRKEAKILAMGLGLHEKDELEPIAEEEVSMA